jgi:hypothetical protein
MMTNSVAQDAIPVTADVLLSPMSRGGAAVTWYSENTPASKLALLLESSHLVTTRNVRGQACNDFQPPSTSRALAPRSGVMSPNQLDRAARWRGAQGTTARPPATLCPPLLPDLSLRPQDGVPTKALHFLAEGRVQLAGPRTRARCDNPPSRTGVPMQNTLRDPAALFRVEDGVGFRPAHDNRGPADHRRTVAGETGPAAALPRAGESVRGSPQS